jgi:membrane protein implicated in regulation of membrane protease activity
MPEREETSGGHPPLLAIVAGAVLILIAVAVVLVAVRRWRSESGHPEEGLGESVSVWEGAPPVAAPPREQMGDVLARARVEDEDSAAAGTPTAAGTDAAAPPAVAGTAGATQATDAVSPAAVTEAAASGPTPVRYGEPRDVVHVVDSLVPAGSDATTAGEDAGERESSPVARQQSQPEESPERGERRERPQTGETGQPNGPEETGEPGDGRGRSYESGGRLQATVLLVAALIVAAVAVWYLFFSARPAV